MATFRSPFRLLPAGAALLLAAASAMAQGDGDPLPPAATASRAVFDHGPFDALLREFVRPGGQVDYVGWKERGRERLGDYLRAQQAVDGAGFARWPAAERDAFWINAYNAWTVELILDAYPVESIKDLGGFLSSVFSKRFVPLQHLSARHRKTLSLGEIEHEILGEGPASPLFHFAIVCASRSCPPLRPRAYAAEGLPEQLAAQARAFLADPQYNDAQAIDGVLRISKIFDWSEDDFEAQPGGVRGFLRAYGPPEMLRRTGGAPVRIRYRDYDWRLNALRAASQER